jgi:negative regulator of sigma E activity
MTVTRETLMAFVDGELAPDEARRVAAEVAKDPALNAYVEQQKTLAGTLKSAFAPVLEAPIPERIERAVRDTPIPWEGLLVRLQRLWHELKTRVGQAWLPAAALAAGIALGILLDGSFGTGSDLRTKDGALIAQDALAQALTVELASEQIADTGSAARIGVSFRSADGFFCRSFETRTGARGAVAGIACLKNGDWQIAALAGATPRAEGEFATAGGDMPSVIRSALSAMIAGDPLDAAQERAARDRGWSPQ